jgi:hypothetical protein
MARPYNPLTKAEQHKKAMEVARKFCPNCGGDYETKCRTCIWYLIMNNIIGEEEF